jgi:hypothetical protein
MSNNNIPVFDLDSGKVHEAPDMILVRDYRTFIQSVIDGVTLCYTPLYTNQLKAINSRIKLLSNRIDSLNNYLSESTMWDRDLLNQRDATLSELKMLFADRKRTQTMSAMVDRKAIDSNLHKLHKAAQYLYRWGYIETYTISKGMISGVWFDRYEQPEDNTFSTIKWEVCLNTHQSSYQHEHITKNVREHERDKMQDNTPTAERKVFNGDMQWDKNQYRVKPIAHQNTTATLIRRIRRARKMPLFTETFKQWSK